MRNQLFQIVIALSSLILLASCDSNDSIPTASIPNSPALGSYTGFSQGIGKLEVDIVSINNASGSLSGSMNLSGAGTPSCVINSLSFGQGSTYDLQSGNGRIQALDSNGKVRAVLIISFPTALTLRVQGGDSKFLNKDGTPCLVLNNWDLRNRDADEPG